MVNSPILGLRNPTILASGILGNRKSMLEEIARRGAGAVTTKSISLEPRKGHDSPIIVETECGLLNAVGYANPGIEEGIKEFSGWEKSESKLIFSIVGKDADEFQRLVERVKEVKPQPAAIEIPLSCPHTPGYGLLAGQGTPEKTKEIVKAVRKKTNLPLIVKISPSVPALGEVAKAAETAGADIINMGNTAGPGMVIDIERGKPFLHFKYGGMSGPMIKPLIVRCVYDIYKVIKIPIIATGGITYGKDAIEMFMAGASAVGIGTAIFYRGLDVFKLINKEIDNWLEKHGHGGVEDIRGIAHDN